MLASSFGISSLALADDPATVHVEHLTGREAGAIGHEIDRGGVKIRGLPDASAVERLLSLDKGANLRIIRRALGHGSFHERRRDHVKPNTGGGVLRRGSGG